MPASVPRTLADGMTILGLPRKIGNANTDLTQTNGVFFIGIGTGGRFTGTLIYYGGKQLTKWLNDG